MHDGADFNGRLLEGGWSLQAMGEGQRTIRLVFGDTELTRAFPGLVIGRHPALCDRSLADRTISHRHCRLSVREQHLLVEDLNATNGTAVEGAQLAPFQPVRILSGQILTLGRLKMRVERIPAGAGLR